MAWRCHGSTNTELIQNLKHAGIIKNSRVYDAMLKVDRANYCSYNPYHDRPQSIGYAATISAPHMHAYALEILEPSLQPGMRCLDVGSGSGYLAACMAHMVGSQGHVVGVEHIHELVVESMKNVQKDCPDLIKSHRLEFIEGDGRQGYEEGAPYDCIHVGAAFDQYPKKLLNQLKSPGRLFVPVGRPQNDQTVVLFTKDVNGHVTQQNIMGVLYVPLTSKEEQLKGR